MTSAVCAYSEKADGDEYENSPQMASSQFFATETATGLRSFRTFASMGIRGIVPLFTIFYKPNDRLRHDFQSAAAIE